MGQVKVQVRLTNAREAVMAQLGHLQAAQGHHSAAEALPVLPHPCRPRGPAGLPGGAGTHEAGGRAGRRGRRAVAGPWRTQLPLP